MTQLIDWLVCCLLAGLDLQKRMLLMCSISMAFTCPLLSWCKISSPFKENNNVVVFPFPFHIFMPLANLWFRPPEKPLAFGRGKILIQRFIRSPPISAVFEVAHSLSHKEQYVGVFPSLRMRPKCISHTFLILLKSWPNYITLILKIQYNVIKPKMLKRCIQMISI